jgi:hypothetical protein
MKAPVGEQESQVGIGFDHGSKRSESVGFEKCLCY